MRKILVILFALAGLTTGAQVSNQVISSYSSAGNSDEGTSVSQSFQVSDRATITAIKTNWRLRTGTATETATVSIYAHSGTYGTSSVPTGTALATSDPVSLSTLTSTASLLTFSFSGINVITLEPGYYCLVTTTTSTTANPYAKISSATASGNMARYSGGTWTAYSTYDYVYEVDGTILGAVDYSNGVSSYTSLYSGSTNYAAQSFSCSKAMTLDNVRMYLRIQSSPTGNATVYVWSHTGTFGSNGTPTGAALATSDVVDVSTISGTGEYKKFTFSGANRISLTASANYFIGVYYSGGNSTNLVRVYYSSGSAVAGNMAYSSNGSSWTTATTDYAFFTYRALGALLNPTTITHVSCNGGSTGALTITASAGTAPYTYLWSTGATTTGVTGLAAGTYTVSVTDASSIRETATFTITQPTAMSISGSMVSCGGGSNGSITLTASNGASPYSYLWSNGATTNPATGLSCGTYAVTVTDANACKGTGSFTIIASQIKAIVNTIQAQISKINTTANSSVKKVNSITNQ